MIVSKMLPFLRKLVEKVMATVNDDTRWERGQYLIKLTKRDLENDIEVLKLFETCAFE